MMTTYNVVAHDAQGYVAVLDTWLCALPLLLVGNPATTPTSDCATESTLAVFCAADDSLREAPRSVRALRETTGCSTVTVRVMHTLLAASLG